MCVWCMKYKLISYLEMILIFKMPHCAMKIFLNLKK